MLEKTRGIVLHTVKYSDSGIVATLYTREFGRLSVLVRGLRKKKSGKYAVTFQPMFILELEFYHKPSRDIQLLKEYSLVYPFYSIHSDIRKSSVAIFLGEVLSSVLAEETSNTMMFGFIEDSILWFEKTSADFANFHLSFLTGLSRHLGIAPSMRKDPEKFLDLRNGNFTVLPPVHGDYASEEISSIVSQLMKTSLDESNNIRLTGRLRNEVLETLVRYYEIHLPSLRKIKSLDVLKEVFG